MRLSQLILVLVIVTASSCAGCAGSLDQGALPAAEVKAMKAFPYATFHAVVQKHVDGEGRVDYAGLSGDRASLQKFTATVAKVGPTEKPRLFTSKSREFAYYIDAYNALAMLNALERYPSLQSLQYVRADFFYLTNVRIDGSSTNLYAFEHQVIRPAMRAHYVAKRKASQFGRVHFALNCASASCPKLPNEAFDPEHLEAQLDREARRFVAEPRNVSVDKAKKTVTLSQLFEWYREDFTNNAGEPVNPLVWINGYRAADAQLDPTFKVVFADYDWTLNDTKLQR